MKHSKKIIIISLGLLIITIGLSFLLFYKFSISVAITPIDDACTIYKERCSHMTFETRDHVKLDAVLIDNAAASDIAMYVHGFGMNNGDSFSLGKIETLLLLNYKVFALSLRNHGYSDKRSTTAGKTEALDVLAAINYIEKYLTVRPSLIWCASMGCNATVYGIIEKEFEKPDYSVPYLIIESPMEEVYRSIRAYLDQNTFFPWIPIGFLSLKISELYSHMSFGNQYIAEDIRLVNKGKCLVLYGAQDEYFERSNAEMIATTGKCDITIIDNASHADVLTNGKQQILDAIRNIFL